MSEDLVVRGEPWRPPRQGGTRDVLVGVVRFAAGTYVKGVTWGLGFSVRLARAVNDPRAASDLTEDVVESLREFARELLGVSDVSLDERIKRLLPPAAAPVQARPDNGALDSDSLREQGLELFRQAADVNLEEAAHPAYAQILLELAPDEARILRLLATEGPQPAVDIRASQIVRGGQVVAEGLNMIGAEAGARHTNRVEGYLTNLERLGLVRFSAKPVEDEIVYQVLEAQPHVLEALKQASRARSVHRSIRLTGFGEDFCEVCLPLDEDVIELGPRSAR